MLFPKKEEKVFNFFISRLRLGRKIKNVVAASARQESASQGNVNKRERERFNDYQNQKLKSNTNEWLQNVPIFYIGTSEIKTVQLLRSEKQKSL